MDSSDGILSDGELGAERKVWIIYLLLEVESDMQKRDPPSLLF